MVQLSEYYKSWLYNPIMKISVRTFFQLILFFSGVSGYAQIITTVAGGNGAAYSGDGGPATSAQFNNTISVALDSADNLYIADFYNNRIRKVTKATGVVTTIAGTGVAGFAGDGGPAVNAQINNPGDLCVDAAGNVYFIDNQNFRVRKIEAATGIISTVAGNGGGNYAGQTTPAIAAGIDYPNGLAVDATYLYLSLFSLHRICTVNLTTGILTTIGGTGTAGFSGDGGPAVNADFWYPAGLSVTATGAVYVADYNNNRIRKIDAAGNVATVVGNGAQAFSGDGGPALSASLNLPTGVFVDAASNIFIADRGNDVVRKVAASTGNITTVAGSGNYGYGGDGGLATSPCAKLADPHKVREDAAGNLFIADQSNNCIRKVDTSHLMILVPGINIATGNLSICQGSSVTFNATPLNSGNNPMYQWKINGSAAGTNSAVFTTSSLSNGDSVTCDLTVTLGCGPTTVTSNAIIVNVSPSVNPAITIASSAVSICAGNDGTNIIFTTTVSNGGITPTYQWKINGNDVGSNSPSLTGYPLANGDTVDCMLISNAICAVPDTVFSNSIKIAVAGITSPVVNITAASDSICQGSSAIFTAIATNSGNEPSYQWQVNGVNAGTDSTVFSSSNLRDGDVITCTITTDPSFSCVSSTKANSNPIVIHVSTAISPSVQINASGNDSCQGGVITFSATAQNAGNSPFYQWQVNGSNAGTDSTVFSSDSFSDNDQVSCVLSGVTTGCQSAPVSSNIIVVSVKDSPVVSIVPTDTSVLSGSRVQLTATISGTIASYTWTTPGSLVNPLTLTPLTIPLTSNSSYSISVTGANGCTTVKTAVVNVYRELLMPSAFTPNNDGVNDVFRIPPNVLLTLIDFSVYNRWGAKVFSTSNISAGWDGKVGGIRADAGTYVYTVNGMSQGKKVFLKGTVELIR